MKNIKKILIVEDDPGSQKLLTHMLRDYELTVYDNPTKVLGVTGFDLFILDNKMPYMTGVQFLTEMRKNGINTPALILSAVTDYEGMQKAYTVGLEDYMLKPFTQSQIQAKLEQIERKIENRKLYKNLLGEEF